MFIVGARAVAALLAVLVLPVLCQPVFAADVKRPAKSVSAAATAPEPSGSEVVGKLLRDEAGPSDPDVPLPQRGLGATQGPASTPLAGPQMFGRREDGGGVFGLKIPIPVTRSAN